MEEQNPAFEQTRWSLVARASRDDSHDAQSALNEICRLYWYPLYAWLRRTGHSPEASEDLTQEFLAWFVTNRHFEKADSRQGKLRSFLLGCLKRFLANQRRKEHTQKRGGEIVHLSIDQEWAEGRLKNEASDGSNPDLYFDRNWARSIFENALTRLRQFHESKDQLDRYQVLRPFLTGENCELTLAEAGSQLATTESSAKGMVHRMRERFKELLLQEVRETLVTPGSAESELDYLLNVLSAA